MIEIRNLHHTKLKYDPLIKTIKRYVGYLKLKHEIVIIFDKRLARFDGLYRYNYSKWCHNIQLHPQHDESENAIAKWITITSLLHELKHAQQNEKLDFVNYISSAFCQTKEIQKKERSEHFSKRETEARVYENQHVRRAVDFYNNCC